MDLPDCSRDPVDVDRLLASGNVAEAGRIAESATCGVEAAVPDVRAFQLKWRITARYLEPSTGALKAVRKTVAQRKWCTRQDSNL